MIQHYDFITDQTPYERILTASEDHDLLQYLWVFEREYSETLNYALKLLEDKDSKAEERYGAKNFIDFFMSNLIRNPSDIITALSEFDTESNKISILRKIVEDKLVDINILISLVSNKKVLTLLPLDDDWLSYPLRMYAKHKMDTSKELLEVSAILPDYADINNLTAQYILSWAFEENKLSENACDTFKKRFPKKYEILVEIKKNM